MTDEYEDRLHRAWVGEIQGEAFFVKLAELTEDAEMKRKWTILAELERRVGEALEPIVDRSLDEEVEVGPTEAAASTFASVPLAEGLASIVDVIDGAVEAYSAMRDTGPEAHAVELDILARHEIALQTFVRLEITLDTMDSLSEAEALLEELRSR